MTTTLTETFHDEFVTAIEGGIGYWSEVVWYDWDRDDWFAVIEDIEGDQYRITEDTMLLGFVRLAESEGTDEVRCAARNLLDSQGGDTEAWEVVQDADTADTVVQFALFGELVYG